MIALLKNMKFGYLSIIKKHPHGVINRMQRFDEWVKTWNDPNVKTYYDYFQNGEKHKFEAFIPDSVLSKHEVAQCASRFRPAIFDMNESFKINQNQFADDQFLSVNQSELSFTKFIKQCLKSQTRKDLHKFFLWSVTAGVLGIISVVRGVFYSDYHQKVVQFEPDETFYHYNPNILEYDVKKFIFKVNTINRHSVEVLKEAKERAEQRKINKKI